jgi:hypothetical protein
MDKIKEIWGYISQVVNSIGSAMDSLIERLDNVQFTDDFIITKFLALIHYIVGTPLYLMFTGLTVIGLGFLEWKLIKIVVNSVSNFIPGLKGRIKIE